MGLKLFYLSFTLPLMLVLCSQSSRGALIKNISESQEEASWNNKITELLRSTNCGCDKSNRADNTCRRSSTQLEHYNILRKLLHKDSAKTIEDIDNLWLEELGYKYWKKERLKEFVDKKLEPIQQQEFVRHVLFFSLSLTSKDTNQDYLFFRWFNLLRELTGQTPIISCSYECKYSPLENKDYEWLQDKAIEILQIVHQNKAYREHAYTVWRDFFLDELKKSTESLNDYILIWAANIPRSLQQSLNDKTTSYLIHACDTYNMLRELFKLEKIENESDIDQAWLDKIAHEIKSLKDKVDREDMIAHFEYRMGMKKPDAVQQALFDHAKKTAGIEEDILLLSSTNKLTGFAGKSIIGVNNFPDLDYQLFIFYHELGHRFYKDAETHESIKKSEISALELVESNAFKAVETTVEKYSTRAKLVLDSNTSVGKQLQYIINTTTTFWIPPINEGEAYVSQLLRRTMEKRADLFALEKLYEQNKINAIVLWIHNLAFGLPRDNKPYIIVDSDDPHPSDVERALYAIGFLAEKGFNVLQTLKQWEEQGVCEPIGNILQEVIVTEEAGINRDRTTSALQEIFIDEAHHNYQLWKKETYGHLNNQAVTSDLKLLFSILQSALDALNEYQAICLKSSRTNALNLYNFLRELSQEEQTTSWYVLDKDWMRNLYGQTWSKLCVQEYKEAHYTQEEQLRDLTVRALSDLAFFHYEPDERKIGLNDYLSGRPFYLKSLFNAWSAYNLLRALLAKSTADYPEYEIDYVWLQNLGFQYWKADMIKFFSQQNFTFDQQVGFCIISHLTGVEKALEHFEIQTPLPPYVNKIGSILNFKVTCNENPKKELLDKSTAKNFSFIYSYNLIRELFDKPKADTEEDIDHHWILEKYVQNQCVSCKQPQDSLFVAEQPIPKSQQLEIEKLAIQAIRGLKPFNTQNPKKLNAQSLKDFTNGWCAYSLLKAMLGANKAKLTDYHADYAWLKDFSFQLWKKRVETLFAEEEQHRNLTFKERMTRIIMLQIAPFSTVFWVASFFSPFFPSLSPGECNFVDAHYGWDLNRLYSYNLLREYFKESKAENTDQIDDNWMVEASELDYSRLIASL